MAIIKPEINASPIAKLIKHYEYNASEQKIIDILYFIQGITLVTYNKLAFKNSIININGHPQIHISSNNISLKNFKINKNLEHIVSKTCQEYNQLKNINSYQKNNINNPLNKQLTDTTVDIIQLQQYFSENILVL